MNDTVKYLSLFANPVMSVQLDLDLEKLTEFAFEMWNKDKEGVNKSNIGGWQSDNVGEEKHEEFIKLKKEINHYLQIYHSEVFRGMKFKENVKQDIEGMWVNINEKDHWNEWHIHPGGTISGAFYIKHDSTGKHGNIIFENPISLYLRYMHWPNELVEEWNQTTASKIESMPEPNILLLFPSWLKHRVGSNLRNDTRISLSFNSILN